MAYHEEFMKHFLVVHNTLKFFVNEGHGKLVIITNDRKTAKRFTLEDAQKLVDDIDHGDRYTIEHIWKNVR